MGLPWLVPDGRSFGPADTATNPPDSPAVKLGERLFRETRFAQFFFAHQRDLNGALAAGDPSIADLPTWTGANIPNPYAGKSINCASCHLEREAANTAGVRSLNDYSVRSIVPFRSEDTETHTLRNSPAIEGAVVKGKPLHFDGEFATSDALIVGGWTGRNFGWLAGEAPQAIRHIAAVIRADNGRFPGAGNAAAKPYRDAFLSFGQDADALGDEALVQLAASFVTAYMESKAPRFASPFDRFLAKNSLPRGPAKDELPASFHLRLLESILKKERAGKLALQENGGFGSRELSGLKIFLDANRGNCASCHQMPLFTDFAFHNIGISQLEYDQKNGPGAFMARKFPSLSERTAADIENARRAPALERPEWADLGLWSVFANPAMPAPQAGLRSLLCLTVSERECGVDEVLLESALGRFKTPGLRNLQRGAPFFHDGGTMTIEDAAGNYLILSMMARRDKLRSPDPELKRMRLSGPDRVPLAAFLRSLGED